MKKLKEITFDKIADTDYYIIYHKTCGSYVNPPETFLSKGTGKEVIDLLKETFSYDSWMGDVDLTTPGEKVKKDFFEYAEALNGDGWDWIQLFEL